MLDEEEKKRLQAEQPRQLTGVPMADDKLNFALPVIAPYGAVMGYKFKVKVTPGNEKCGKAVKTARMIFEKSAVGTPLQEYVKAVSDNEATRAMPGNVKVSAPGLEKAKTNQGGKKKKKK